MCQQSVPGLVSYENIPMKVQHMKVVRRVKLLPNRHSGGLSNLVAQLFQVYPSLDTLANEYNGM